MMLDPPILALAPMARRLRMRAPDLADAARRKLVPAVVLGRSILFNPAALEQRLSELAARGPVRSGRG